MNSYQITSTEQKRHVSSVIAQKPNASVVTENCEVSECSQNSKTDKCNDKVKRDGEISSTVSVKNIQGTELSSINVNDVGTLVNELVQKNTQKGKTKIKIEIEITHE